jgi:hypothetical protein
MLAIAIAFGSLTPRAGLADAKTGNGELKQTAESMDAPYREGNHNGHEHQIGESASCDHRRE